MGRDKGHGTLDTGHGTLDTEHWTRNTGGKVTEQMGTGVNQFRRPDQKVIDDQLPRKLRRSPFMEQALKKLGGVSTALATINR